MPTTTHAVPHHRERLPGTIDPRVSNLLVSSISGNYLWYRPESLIGTSNGASVASWPDESGRGDNAANGGANQPVYVASAVNGQGALNFSTIKWLAHSALTLNPATWLMVLSRNVSTNNVIMIFDGTRYSYLQYGNTWAMSTSGTMSQALNINTWTLKGARYTGTQIKPLTNATDHAPLTDSSSSYLWYLGGSTLGFTAEITIAELMVYNRAVTDDELAALRSYLNGKYGLW